MEFVRKNIVDILFAIGSLLLSIGFFKLNLIAGFLATGLLFILVAFLMSRGGD